MWNIRLRIILTLRIRKVWSWSRLFVSYLRNPRVISVVLTKYKDSKFKRNSWSYFTRKTNKYQKTLRNSSLAYTPSKVKNRIDRKRPKRSIDQQENFQKHLQITVRLEAEKKFQMKKDKEFLRNTGKWQAANLPDQRIV